MDRKSLIFCLSALAAMVVAIVAGTAFLYRKDSPFKKPIQERYGLAYAVPANAVAVFFLSEASEIDAPIFSTFAFPSKLAQFFSEGNAGQIAKNRMVISLHYAGSLAPLYIFDAGGCSDSPSQGAESLMEFLRNNGLSAEFVNCSAVAPGSPLASRSIIIAAKTKTQVHVSRNQLAAGFSLMDASGFAEAASDASEDALLISYDHARVLFEKMVSRRFLENRYDKTASGKYSAMAAFFSTVAQWGVVDLSSDRDFNVVQHFAVSDFMGVMDHSNVSASTVSEVLPYSARFVLTIPMSNASAYIASYEEYLESVQKIGVVAQRQDELRKKTRVKPADFVKRLKITEVATASIPTSTGLERVNLMRLDNVDTLLLRSTGKSGIAAAKNVLPYAFSEYAASVFGHIFNLKDESHFIIRDQWLITGSRAALQEYESGQALEYNLKRYVADAGKDDLLADRLASCVVYMDIPKGDKAFKDVIKTDFQFVHDNLKGDAEYAPVVMSVYKKDGRLHTDIKVHQLDMKRLRPEKFVKEMSVEVPSGPFPVINSSTGKTNLFYQANGAIGLKDENGNALWGVPFSEPLCGTAHNVDYYGNGNLQILFGAGSNVYLIARNSAPVAGFPKNLGKEILLGPDVYRFGEDNRHTMMVLHKDNTIEMYDFSGRKPSSWKGIHCKEPVRGLPERLEMGDRNFWAVRTASQILIYPFEGGDPLNSFSGNKMFVPTAEVVVKNSKTIQAECYDGKTRSLKLY
jgi:hypothetical protein